MLSNITSTGIQVDVTNKALARLPEPNGRHYWIVAAVWHVADPARTRVELDAENLTTIDGPGCLHCEQHWRPDIGAHCPGEQSTTEPESPAEARRRGEDIGPDSVAAILGLPYRQAQP